MSAVVTRRSTNVIESRQSPPLRRHGYKRFYLALVFGLAIATATSGYLCWQAAVDADGTAAAFALTTGAQSTTLYDAQDQPAFNLFIEQRSDVPLNRMAGLLVEAVLTAEDRRFFRHSGFDPNRVVSAAWANLRAGRVVQGGS